MSAPEDSPGEPEPDPVESPSAAEAPPADPPPVDPMSAADRPGPPVDPGNNAPAPPIRPTDASVFIPLYAVTAVMGAIFVIAPLLVRRGPDRGIIQCCIMLTTFSLWIFWATVYVAHLNPLVGPRLDNFTVAWIARKHILETASASAALPGALPG